MKNDIRRYLKSGDYDIPAAAWPGNNIMEKDRNQHKALREALIAAVKRRAGNTMPPPLPVGFNLTAYTRARVTPMVKGLFPAAERETVLGLLERSVIFLTPENFEHVLREERWLHTAWNLANLYLGSLGLHGLDGSRSCIQGLSQETTCFVSLAYFTEKDRFTDFIVHEAAHIFHNWKRRYAGMPYTRTREWLLQIDYRKRETFAYACEAFSRILTLSDTRRERMRLVEEFTAGTASRDESVKFRDLVDILREAAGARNGWKRILRRCAPAPRQRMQHSTTAPSQTCFCL